MNPLFKLVRLADRINRYAGILAAWTFVAIGFFVAYEVVMRKLGLPTTWTEEVSQIAQIWCIYLGSAYVLQTHQMITVDIIGDRFSPKLRKALDLFALLVIIGFSATVVYQNIKEVRFSLKLGVNTDTILALPIWLIQISLAIGFALLILQALSELVKGLSPTPLNK